MKLNTISKYVAIALATAGLTACGSDSNDSTTKGPANLKFSFGMENTKEIANDNNIPMPNDLYKIASNGTTTSKLVVFGCGQTDLADEQQGDVENATKCAMEDLDGWSTTAPFTLPMTGDVSQIDTSTFINAVRLFNGNSELTYDLDFTVQISSFGHLQILPLKVFDDATTYTLVVTEELKDQEGVSVLSSDAYLNKKAGSDAIALEIQSAEANAVGVTEAILYAANITTQSIGTELESLITTNAGIQFDSADSQPYYSDKISSFPLDCKGSECVEKLSGTLEIPNYLPSISAVISQCSEDVDNLESASFWFNLNGANAHLESFKYTKTSCPKLYQPIDFSDTTTSTVEVQMVFPEKKSTGFGGSKVPQQQTVPVIIAAHGITAVKELGNGGMTGLDNFVQSQMANTPSPSGNTDYAVIAIDHIYHGSRSVSLEGNAGFDCDNDGKADQTCFKNTPDAVQLAGNYDISVSSSVRGLFAGHDHADSKNFLKADALLTSRDNFRKVVADILNLKAAVASIATPTTDDYYRFDASNISIYGHSMGAIAAATAAGIEKRNAMQSTGTPFTGTILANPGGAIGGIVMNSNWLGKDEVPPAVKFLPEYRLRMARELEIDVVGDEQATLDAVRVFAENNPKAYLAKSDVIAPQFLSEFQYLIQAVVDTADPLNYAADLVDEPILAITAVGNKDSKGTLFDGQFTGLTAADQTVPIKVELDGQTMITRCIAFEGSKEMASVSSECGFGEEQVPYYSMNITEFPLAGAEPLEKALQLNDVRDGANRSYSHLIEGNHNIGVGTLTDDVTQGTRDFATVKLASDSVARQATAFLSGGGVVELTPEDEALLDR